MHMLMMLVVTAFILILTGRADHFDDGYAAANQGQVDAAIYHYTQALQSGDLSRRNQARALNNRAIAFYQKGLYDRALADLDRAMQLAPEDLDIIRNRQTAWLMAGGGSDTTQSAVFANNSSGFAGGLRTQQRIKLLGIL